jgi:hypothetical protein
MDDIQVGRMAFGPSTSDTVFSRARVGTVSVQSIERARLRGLLAEALEYLEGDYIGIGGRDLTSNGLIGRIREELSQ